VLETNKAVDISHAKDTRVLSAVKKKKVSDKKPKLTQEERTALSDKRMFEAAMELICEQGANRTTLKEVCEKAGYSRGLANYRFGSKDAFFDKLIGHFNRAWKSELQKNVGDKTGLPAIQSAALTLETFLLERTQFMRSRYIIMYESIATENIIQSKLRANHKAYNDDIARWVAEGIEEGDISPETDAEAFAAFYSAFIFGTVFQWLASPEQIDIKRVCTFFRLQVDRTLAI
jgi:AcrR family transcriptional regulator